MWSPFLLGFVLFPQLLVDELPVDQLVQLRRDEAFLKNAFNAHRSIRLDYVCGRSAPRRQRESLPVQRALFPDYNVPQY